MQSRPRHAPALLLSAIAACAALGLAASPAAAAPLPTTTGSTAASTTSLSDLSDSEQRAAKQLGGDPARAKVLGLNAAATEDPAFYTPPATLPAKNGTVIRKEPATFYLDPLKALKIPGKAERASCTAPPMPRARPSPSAVPFSRPLPPGRAPEIGPSLATALAPRVWRIAAPPPARWPSAPSTSPSSFPRT